MKHSALGAIVSLAILLSACGETAPAASAPASVAPASPAASAKPAASAAASVSAKPAASAAASASAKPAASAAAKPAEGGAVGPAVSSQPIAAKPGTINLALVGGSPSATPIYIALENKLFEKYNAPVQLIIITAPAAMAALISGDVQVAMDGGAMVSADI